MEFQKIQMTKKNTLNVVFKDGNGNLVTVVGGNIVHKDLKACMKALIPHLSLLTEQREAFGKTLKELEADRMQDGNSQSVFRLMTVDTVTLSDEEQNVTFSGCRILQNGMVIKVESPQVNASDTEHYQYVNDLFLAIDGLKYEAESYWKEQKWGMKEGNLDFAADDPFEGKVATGAIPEVKAEEPKKKTKTKKVKIA